MKNKSIRDLEPGTYYIHPETLKAMGEVAEKNPIGAYFALGRFKFISHEFLEPGQIVKADLERTSS